MARPVMPWRPGGLPAWFNRLPVLLYRLGLGNLLAPRLLLLSHVQQRSTTINSLLVTLLRFDHGTDTYLVLLSASQAPLWERALLEHPCALLTAGRRRVIVQVRKLSEREANLEYCGYARAEPEAFQLLAQALAARYGLHEPDCHVLAQRAPLLALAVEP